MHFYHPWMLTVLVILPLLYWYFLKRRRPSVVVSTITPVKRLNSRRHLTFFEFALLGALLIAGIALARPRKALGERIFRARGLDIVLALDMSGSMQAIDRPQDIDDESFVSGVGSKKIPDRLTAAKNEIRRFIEMRPNDRIGLIGFADLAYSFVPPTLDHSILLERLAMLSPGEIGEKTGIAAPIGTAVERLRRSKAPRRVLVLFTDGTNTVENALTPEQAAQLAKDFSVIIHTVGIGSENAYIAADTMMGPRLLKTQGEYDSALLKKLASITGGSFFHAADADGLRQTMKEINKLEKTNIEQPRPTEYYEYAPLLALIAAVLLTAGVIAETTFQLRLP